MDRREALKTTGGLAVGACLAGCNSDLPNIEPAEPIVMPLVDVHCHLFNGSDLPVVRFIKIVVLHHYPTEGIRTLDIRDKDAMDGLIALLTAIVGRTRAPTATEEVAVLKGQNRPLALNRNTTTNETAVMEATAALLSQNQFAVTGDVKSNAIRTIRGAIVLAATGVVGAAVSDDAMASEEADALARAAYHSNSDLGTLLRWFALFTRYRHVLSEQLWADHARQGFPPLLLCPAAIDYDRWLGENVDASPLPLQVDVMGALARRASGPVVHGYVSFDPLRQAYFAAGNKLNDFDPLGLVKRALQDEGFLGVKLYPPMGFRPTGNESAVCQKYPKWATDDLQRAVPDDRRTAACKPRPADGSVALGAMLDRAMAGLFDLCVAEDASIIAHATYSNESNEGYADRADPAYWVETFRRWPKLRVCLAHFGHFQTRSAGTPVGTQLPEASWEWALGRSIKQAGDSPVFADISYLSEVAGSDVTGQDLYAKYFRRWLDDFDPECRHLIFGSDWTMLGLNRSYRGYTKNVHAFFKNKVGLDQARLDRLFIGNAGHFLGLRRGDPARERLLRFYERNRLPQSRLPVIEAT